MQYYTRQFETSNAKYTNKINKMNIRHCKGNLLSRETAIIFKT
jgi:hypothetical protein